MPTSLNNVAKNPSICKEDADMIDAAVDEACDIFSDMVADRAVGIGGQEILSNLSRMLRGQVDEMLANIRNDNKVVQLTLV